MATSSHIRQPNDVDFQLGSGDRTRPRHTDKPFFVRVQNNDLLGLAQRAMTGSGGRCGKYGTLHRRRAAAVGKYMPKVISSEHALASMVSPTRMIDVNNPAAGRGVGTLREREGL